MFETLVPLTIVATSNIQIDTTLNFLANSGWKWLKRKLMSQK